MRFSNSVSVEAAKAYNAIFKGIKYLPILKQDTMSSVTQYQAKQVLPGIVFAHLQPSEDKGLKSQEKDFGALRTSSHSPPPHWGRRVDACIHQKPSDRDVKGLLSEIDTSLIEFRRHKDWCLNPTWRNVLVKVCGRAAYLVPRGRRGCAWGKWHIPQLQGKDPWGLQQSHKRNKWHAVHFQGKFTQEGSPNGERDPNRVGQSRRHIEDVAADIQALRVGLIGQSKWHLPHQESCSQSPLKIMTTTKHMKKLSCGRKATIVYPPHAEGIDPRLQWQPH